MGSHICITVEQGLDLVKQMLPPKQLNTVKLLIFRQAWLGKGYGAIAEECGYDNDYIRMAGCQLWQSLSEALKQEVTKKNFKTILENYAQKNFLVASTVPEFPGSPIPLGSRFYIQRPLLENQAYTEIGKQGSLLQIKAPRKMGKSTFLLRIIQRGLESGCQTIQIDFQQIDREILSNLNLFLRWFCTQISYDLGIEPNLNQFWNEDLGSKVSSTFYLRQYILKIVKKPLLLVLTEINHLFDYPNLIRDFFPLLRSWHEESKHQKGLEKLNLVMSYSAEVDASLQAHQSPFNVGLTLELNH